MRAAASGRFPILILLFALILFPADSSPTSDRQPIDEALQWVRRSPRQLVQYNYDMTARVRFLLFWAGKDDVGGGYIRRGVSSDDPRQEFIQVLFGSDPAKAPRAINRWGAGTEISWHAKPLGSSASREDVTSSAFFGFIKSSRGKSATEMQEELRREQEEHGQHTFTGILSRVEPARAISLVTHLQSDTDYDLHDYERAEPVMLDHLSGSTQPVRSLQDRSRCRRAEEFLATVAELMDAALASQKARVSRCYVYDAQENTLTLEHISAVDSLPVELHRPNNTVLLDTTYSNLLQLDFVSTHKRTGKKVYFSILTGSKDELRGVPVQIRYQPNWWFQVVLNLIPADKEAPGNAIASW